MEIHNKFVCGSGQHRYATTHSETKATTPDLKSCQSNNQKQPQHLSGYQHTHTHSHIHTHTHSHTHSLAHTHKHIHTFTYARQHKHAHTRTHRTPIPTTNRSQPKVYKTTQETNKLTFYQTHVRTKLNTKQTSKQRKRKHT